MFLILDDGTRCRVTNMYDVDGDETDDPELACAIVAEKPDGRWVAVEVSPDMWLQSSVQH